MPYAKRMISAPIILVGRIMSSSKVGRPRHYKVNGTSGDAQLYQVTIAVENVLKGDAPVGRAVIYFFLPAGPYEGSPLLGVDEQGGTWHVGDREIFLLRRDAGVMRTVCDFYRRYVIPVFSCADPRLQLVPSKPIGQKIVDLLLSRGPECTDQQMSEAISNFVASYFDPEYSIKKMRQLAAAGTPPVRKAACEWLFSWKQPCVKPVSQ